MVTSPSDVTPTAGVSAHSVGNLAQAHLHIGDNVFNPPSEIQAHSPSPFLTSLPSSEAGLLGRDVEMTRWQEIGSPGRYVEVQGTSGSGRTRLIAEFLIHDCTGRSDAVAYIDMRGYSTSPPTILRAFANQLNLKSSGSILTPATEGEMQAAIRHKVLKKFNQRKVTVAIDHGEALLEDPGVTAELEELLQSGMFDRANVVVVHESAGALNVGYMRRESPFVLRSIDSVSVAQIVSSWFDVSLSVAKDAVMLLDERMLLPGLVVQASNQIPKTVSSSLEIALSIESIARQRYAKNFAALSRASNGLETASCFIDAVVDSVLGSECCRPANTDSSFYESVRDASEHLLQTHSATGQHPEFVSVVRSDEKLKHALEKNLESHFLERPLTDRQIEGFLARNFDRHAILGEKIFRCANDALAERTANSALGPVVNVSKDNGSTTGPAKFLFLARTSITPWHFYQALSSRDSSGYSVGGIRSAAEVALYRQALNELDARSDFDVHVDLARDLVRESAEQFQDSVEYVLLLSDAAQSAAFRGQKSSVDSITRTIKARAISSIEVEGARYEQLRLLQVRGTIQRVFVGLEKADSCSHELLLELHSIRQDPSLLSDTVSLQVEFIRASLARGGSHDLWSAHLEAVVQATTLSRDDTDSLGLRTLMAATIRRASHFMTTPALALAMLKRAQDAVRDLESEAKERARLGDSRPLLSIARIDRTLAFAYAATDDSAQAKISLTRSRQLMKWITTQAPSSSAWWTYLKSLSGESYEDAGQGDGDDLPPSENWKTFKTEYRRYRDWACKRTLKSSRDTQIEVLAVSLRWAEEGSIHKVAESSHLNWTRLAEEQRKSAYLAVRAKRLGVLEALERDHGPSRHIVLARVAIESQYQRLDALLTQQAFRSDVILNIFDNAIQEFRNDPLLRFHKAKFLRRVWRFDDAIRAFEELDGSLGPDASLVRGLHSVWADALVSSSINDCVDSLEARRRCLRASVLVSSQEQRSANSAIIGLRARVELGVDSAPISSSGLLRALANAKGYLFAAANNSSLFSEFASKANDDALHWGHTALAQDFTTPKILLHYANYLIRAYEVGPRESLLQLQAALSCLEGARVMSPNGRYGGPEHPFFTARALVLAMEAKMKSDAIGWSATYDPRAKRKKSDLEVAESKLMSARDQSVGAFRDSILTYFDRISALTSSHLFEL